MSEVTAPERLVKQPSEKRKYSMDFSALLESGETLNYPPDPTITSELLGGGSSDLIITDIEVDKDNNLVYMWIDGGTHAKQYRIEVKIGTSGGANLEGDGMLRVIDI